MRESSRQNNNSNELEEKLNIKKQQLEPYADLKVIEDLKAKRFGNNTKASIINPRMGIIPTEKKTVSKKVEEETEKKKTVTPLPKSNNQEKIEKKEERKQEQIKPQVKSEVKKEIKPELKKENKVEKKIEQPIIEEEPKEEFVFIEEQVESAVELPKMPAHIKKPGVIEIKEIKGAPKNINNLNPDIRTVVAKGLADGIKVYLIELGVYDVNRGYNASKLSHEITNFIRKTNNNRFNATNLASRFGVDLNVKHDDLEMVNHLSFKDLFDQIGEDYPKSQIIRTTEDILSKENNRFTIFEKKKREELFEMSGIDIPSDE